MKCLHHLLFLALFAVFHQSLSAAPPCKTPEELRAAFEVCLKAGDTNQFWKLHCWTNVSAADEKMHKPLALGPFVYPPGQKPTYSSISVMPAPPDSNTPKPLKRGGSLQSNIPITGIITYVCQTKDMRASDAVAFGKGPDGNYWFVVTIRVPDAKKPDGVFK